MKYEKIGKYLLLEKLSSTALADSYLAKSSVADGLNRFFTVKKFLQEGQRTSELACNLSHGNLLSIYDSGIANGLHYTVMDFLDGLNLNRILKDFNLRVIQFSVDQSLYIVKEAAAGVLYAHRHAVPPKISAENIFITFAGAVKLTEFTDAAVSTNEREVLKDLGTVLEELLGRRKELATELESLVNRATGKNKDQSYLSVSDFYRDINRYLNLQYPDFSQHDFSDFLKNFCSAAADLQRNKLLEYARYSPEKELVAVPDIYEKTIPRAVRMVPEYTMTKSLPDGFAIDPAVVSVTPKKTSFAFEKLNRVNPFAAQLPSTSAPARRPKPKPIAPVETDEVDEKAYFTDFSLGLIALLLLAGICYQFKITINSYSRQLIESMDKTSVAGEPVIIKNGTHKMVDNYSASVIARMRATKQLAYLNIKVLNAPRDIRIFINGKELLEKPPVKMYPIFASEENVVSVFSPKTNTFDVKKLNVAADEVINVQLNLTPKN